MEEITTKYKVVEETLTRKTLIEDTVYIVAYDSFYGSHFDTGIRVMNHEEVIENTLRFLHRNTTATTFTTTTEDPKLPFATIA